MKNRPAPSIVSLGWVLLGFMLFVGCNVDLNIDGRTFHCESDADCETGQRCAPLAGDPAINTCLAADAIGGDVTSDADGGSGCAAAEDCPEAQGCRADGTCGECSDAAECRPGEGCRAGQCTVCLSSADCDGGICVETMCVPCVTGTDDALCASEYGEGYECGGEGLCVPSGCGQGMDCHALGLVCDGGTCTACASSADCVAVGTGEYPDGTVCLDGVCGGGACAASSECPDDAPICGSDTTCRSCQTEDECLTRMGETRGYYCASNGRCEVGTACATNSDCRSDLCNDGRCLDCAADSDCGAGRVCDEPLGVCLDGGCATDQDCVDTGDPCRALQCALLGSQRSCVESMVTGPGDCQVGSLNGDCFPNGTCNAGLICLNDQCEIACPQGQVRCGGACVTLDSDPAHCGACDNACPMGMVCSEGACAATCASDLTECDQSCTNPQIDPAHCGGCGIACDLPNSRESCLQSECVPAICSQGWQNCDDDPTNGCEAELEVDPMNCGVCGNACAMNESCEQGDCVVDACPPGETRCGADCINLNTDPMNCGACGNTCGAAQRCNPLQGQCECDPGSPLDACDAMQANSVCVERSDGSGSICECARGTEAICVMGEECSETSPTQFECTCTADVHCEGLATCNTIGSPGACECGGPGVTCSSGQTCADDGTGGAVCVCQVDSACPGDERCDTTVTPNGCLCGDSAMGGSGRRCTSGAEACEDPTPADGDLGDAVCVPSCTSDSDCTTSPNTVCITNAIDGPIGNCVECTSADTDECGLGERCGAPGGAFGNQCVECDGSALDCGANADICNAMGTCVCTSNNGTPCDTSNPDTQVCDAFGCAACTVDLHCAGNPNGSVCDRDPGSAMFHQCVQCTGLNQSTCGGTTPVCDTNPTSPNYNNCVECVNDQQCGGTTPLCDDNTGTCAGCHDITDGGRCADDPSEPGVECVEPGEAGIANIGRCAACDGHDDCTGFTPLCDGNSYECVKCDDVSDGSLCADDPTEPGPGCLINDGRCVECTSNADCADTTPVCDPDINRCVSGVRVLMEWMPDPVMFGPGSDLMPMPVPTPPGTDRLFVVALGATRSGGTCTSNFSAFYGGRSLEEAWVESGSNPHCTWIGFLREDDIATRLGDELEINVMGGVSGTDVIVWFAVYEGVDQADPLLGADGRSHNSFPSPLSAGTVPTTPGSYGMYVWGSDQMRLGDQEGYTQHGEFEFSFISGVASQHDPRNPSTPQVDMTGLTSRTAFSFIVLNPAP